METCIKNYNSAQSHPGGIEMADCLQGKDVVDNRLAAGCQLIYIATYTRGSFNSS